MSKMEIIEQKPYRTVVPNEDWWLAEMKGAGISRAETGGKKTTAALSQKVTAELKRVLVLYTLKKHGPCTIRDLAPHIPTMSIKQLQGMMASLRTKGRVICLPTGMTNETINVWAVPDS